MGGPPGTADREPDGMLAAELSAALAAPSWASLTVADEAPFGTRTTTFGGAVNVGRSVSTTVTFCVFTVWLPKMSVAVQVTVVTPIGKRFPAGTPDRTTD